MNPPSFFHANSQTKSVLFCLETWPPFHVVAQQELTYVRFRVKKKHTTVDTVERTSNSQSIILRNT